MKNISTEDHFDIVCNTAVFLAEQVQGTCVAIASNTKAITIKTKHKQTKTKIIINGNDRSLPDSMVLLFGASQTEMFLGLHSRVYRDENGQEHFAPLHIFYEGTDERVIAVFNRCNPRILASF